MQNTNNTTLEETECEICGVWFRPNTRRQKLCETCAKNKNAKRDMERNIQRSVRIYGTGAKPELFPHTCKYCGKEYKSRWWNSDYCSAHCRSRHFIETAECSNCGINLFSIGIEKNPCDWNDLYCSNECREEHRWKWARANGRVKNCENCGKEYIDGGNHFCSQACYRAAVKNGWQSRSSVSDNGQDEENGAALTVRCTVCGSTFQVENKKMLDSCTFQIDEDSVPIRICSKACFSKFRSILKQAEVKQKKRVDNAPRILPKEAAAAKDKEYAFQSTPGIAKRTPKDQKYARKYGLCAICKTSYRDCERMESEFRVPPEGVKYVNSLVMECPKFR